jgi:hypothetical protein
MAMFLPEAKYFSPCSPLGECAESTLIMVVSPLASFIIEWFLSGLFY